MLQVCLAHTFGFSFDFHELFLLLRRNRSTPKKNLLCRHDLRSPRLQRKDFPLSVVLADLGHFKFFPFNLLITFKQVIFLNWGFIKDRIDTSM